MSIIKLFMMFCAAVLGCAGSAFADEVGIFKTVHGQVMVEREGGKSEAKVGDPVQEKDRISVQGYGSAGISMNDETLLSIGSNSAMVVDRYSYNPVTREGQAETSILKGTLRYVTGLMARLNPKTIKVKTPAATMGIRGTDFIVEVPDVN